MSRIMAGHIPAPETLSRIAEALEVSPGYLRGGYQLPAWLMEEDIMFLADRQNLPLLWVVREAWERGVTVGELRRLVDIMAIEK
ncbi:MAG: hypothetical protein K6T65_15995 [Peptococcaceae bacterium]|nr:hypothetical protein [Peptococcaceae bacterium]